MNTQSSHEWFQDYQEHMVDSSRSLPELSFEETLDLVTTVSTPSHSAEATSTRPNPSGLSSNVLKNSIGKPTRRRSRASRKAPTTLLNANTKNFRALVQQFTGCHSAPPAFGPYRGPINLNFAQYKYSAGDEISGGANRRQQQNARERTDQSFSSSGNINAAAVRDDGNMSVSACNNGIQYGPGDENALTFDDFDLESFPLQELSSGIGDYSDLLHGNRNDDFWGH